MRHNLKTYLKIVPVLGIFGLVAFAFSNNCGNCGKGHKRSSSEAKFEKLSLKKFETCGRKRK